MLVKTKNKTNTKLISQHPIRYTPYPHIAIVNTGAINHYEIPKIPLLIKKKRILPLNVQLTNGTVLKSTHEGNLQLATLPKEATKSSVLPHITSGTLILVAQLCYH